ncbi:hypothetical protein Goari_010389 [Gossypium aridum]|uniref:Protein kinase domain-containing protein n=1 Tax=Gossypium aridum TaxID=34290 RepID=A0A7J8Y1I2_GOSAI|nr:hypothetical protein [Gossypium aridum]
MSNGNLEKCLHSEICFPDIIQRVDIMIDVGVAIEHLHNRHPTPIIHCDLKPSNILLDKDMVAQVGDFGVAKLLGEGDVMKQTVTLATIGYMALGEFFLFLYDYFPNLHFILLFHAYMDIYLNKHFRNN